MSPCVHSCLLCVSRLGQICPSSSSPCRCSCYRVIRSLVLSPRHEVQVTSLTECLPVSGCRPPRPGAGAAAGVRPLRHRLQQPQAAAQPQDQPAALDAARLSAGRLRGSGGGAGGVRAHAAGGGVGAAAAAGANGAKGLAGGRRHWPPAFGGLGSGGGDGRRCCMVGGGGGRRRSGAQTAARRGSGRRAAGLRRPCHL